MTRSFLCGAVLLLASVALAAGQNPTMLGHPEDYPRVDVEHGARLYAEHCDRCHGADGNGVSGVDLRSGKFRNATTDQQLRNVITNGFPTAGMPTFKFDAADLTGLVAYLRNMNSIDPGTRRTANWCSKPRALASPAIASTTKGAARRRT
jgi:mono/diheme cytochrome c family protein